MIMISKNVIGIYEGGGGRIAAGGGLFAGGLFAAGLIAGGLFASGLNAAPLLNSPSMVSQMVSQCRCQGNSSYVEARLTLSKSLAALVIPL